MKQTTKEKFCSSLKKNKVNVNNQNNRKVLDSQSIKIKFDYRLCKNISQHLGLHLNTVKRWWELKSIPIYYYDDLIRFCSNSNELDGNKEQFYTKPETAKYCFDVLKKVANDLGVDLSNYTFLEPSGWEWCFL